MPGITQEFTNKVRANLMTLDAQPIGRGTLAILLFLDFFVLMSIFEGLSDHTSQLTRPQQFAPQECRNIILNESWTSSNRIDRLADVANSHNRHNNMDERMHAQCKRLDQRLHDVLDNPLIVSDLMGLKAAKVRISDTNQRLRDVNNAYQNELLEDIADRESATEITAIEQEARQRAGSLNQSVSERQTLEARIAQYQEVITLFAHIDSITEAEREFFREDYQSVSFWYPAKRLGMELIFLAPLGLLFWLWHRWATRRGSSFQTLVSSHLLVVVFIPIVLKFLELVYDILPRRLLQDVVELLEAFNIIAIWYYLVMAAGVALAMAVIYYVNKRLFSHERLTARRIQKGQCQQCGVKLAPNVKACADCGFNQFTACESCNEDTYVHSAFCTSCGTERGGNS